MLLNNTCKYYKMMFLNVGSSVFPSAKLRSVQSSTCSNYQSNLAHDGKPNTFSCSLNNPVFGLEGPWWEGDLSSKQTITGIKVSAPRQNYCELI